MHAGPIPSTGLISLGNVSRDTRAAVSREMALIDEAGAFAALLYQKGFAAEYMLTRDRAWLAQLPPKTAQQIAHGNARALFATP